MTPLQDLLRRAAGDLDALAVGWALIGGLAVSARSYPRFTADVDLAVAVADDAEAERLVNELRYRGWRIGTLIEQEAAARLATVRLLAGEDTAPVVDLLFASSGIEPEIVAAAEVLDVFPEQPIPVATIGHLVALKLLARDEARPQDDADLKALVGVAGPEDLALARDAVNLIHQRGFARGRNLSAALAELSARRSSDG
jgi:predicted nucleotidyltransferase